MKTIVDASFRDEADRFSFRFTCEHCLNFDEDNETCINEYPAHPRERSVLTGTIAFCKEFELGTRD